MEGLQILFWVAHKIVYTCLLVFSENTWQSPQPKYKSVCAFIYDDKYEYSQ